MTMDECMNELLVSLRETLSAVEPGTLDRIVDAMLSASGLFVVGAGRSGLVVRMFAMRLMHLGLDVHVVGETVTPAAEPADLLLCVSGTGETESVFRVLERAQHLGVQILLLTAKPSSRMGEIAHHVIRIPATTKHTVAETEEADSQIPGTPFEQAALVILEATVNELALKLRSTHQERIQRHANLE